MLGPWQIGLVCAVLVLLFGAKQLPKFGKSIGETLKEFRKIGKEIEDVSEGKDI